MMEKAKDWVKKNKKQFLVLLLVLFIGAFVRLYKIDGYMTFLGDEGRDAIIVRNLLVKFDPILIVSRAFVLLHDGAFFAFI